MTDLTAFVVICAAIHPVRALKRHPHQSAPPRDPAVQSIQLTHREASSPSTDIHSHPTASAGASALLGGGPSTRAALSPRNACGSEAMLGRNDPQMVKHGDLRGFRVGRMIRIPIESVEKHECQTSASDACRAATASIGVARAPETPCSRASGACGAVLEFTKPERSSQKEERLR